MYKPISDSKQFGYAILTFMGVMGIGLIILARGDMSSIVSGIILLLIGLSPLFYLFYQSWKEINKNER